MEHLEYLLRIGLLFNMAFCHSNSMSASNELNDTI
jgi:hypothetical protein